MGELVKIPVNSTELEGNLVIPEGATGIVLIAHGAGSGRHSPRENFVAGLLNKAGLATLLFDLLTEEEDLISETRFNIDLLNQRLIPATEFIKSKEETKDLSVGYFGASTGAAGALFAAAHFGEQIKAVVSRGGRPDLAIPVIDKVVTPTLLIVGGNDFGVIELNEEAFGKLKCEKKMEIVPGATHLFEEPGCLEQVAELASNWFKKHL
ncbi:dienelactone hydrolase family protein [Bdellovibrionota bacterium]